MSTAAAPVDETQDEKDKKKHPRDPAREVVETIVFVVVLVLLLKLFVTEAFVIPTGSMAETLYGYQKVVTCPKCGHEFPVNSHDEVEGNQNTGKKMRLYGFTCPNCRYMGTIDELHPVPDNGSGDRVLVLKPLFHIREPRRGEVVVFKWPEKPQEKFIAQNYIKRAMGFGGETIAVYRGELFVTTSLSYPEDAVDDKGNQLYPRPANPLDLWRPPYMYATSNGNPNPRAVELFERSRAAGFPAGIGGFEIIRKGEDQMLADQRIVWDNDKQPKELAGKVPSRWYIELPPGAKESDNLPWSRNDKDQPTAFGHDAAEQHWIRYQHLAMPWNIGTHEKLDNAATDFETLKNQHRTFIDNFLGYNAGRDQDPATGAIMSRSQPDDFDKLWVGDLIMECKANFSAGSEVAMELSKGINRFQAIFTEGKVSLRRLGAGGKEFGEPSRPCNVGPGMHDLRFANVDYRLWVWVDGKRVDFGAEGDYPPPTPDQEAAFHDATGSPDVNPQGYTRTNDIEAPASIGAKGKVTVQNIKLSRDIHYTPTPGPNRTVDFSKADIFYVQPGHYLCLGDNSAQSSDSRRWGLVPERLMLGKAVFVFFPVGRIGFIR
jgi:signal peptidase I